MFSKYRNKKTVVDGIVFDSRKESVRYCELKKLEDSGLIQDLKLQVPYELIPSFSVGKIKYRGIKYYADFVYFKNGEKIVEDVKGKRTDVYLLKKKLLAYFHKIIICEI